jgi:Rrf2 family protein
MFRMNKKMEYGILALLYLGEKEDHRASVREMAAHCHIPETLLSKIMQVMKNRSLVKAVYGNQGGYELAVSLGDISLLDLSTALVGPVEIVECLSAGNNRCPAHSGCRLASPMQALNRRVQELFKATSLDHLKVAT